MVLCKHAARFIAGRTLHGSLQACCKVYCRQDIAWYFANKMYVSVQYSVLFSESMVFTDNNMCWGFS